jgi:type I restriction enzyme M protein
MNFTEKANFIWSVADLLRGDFKQSEYGKVILPFTVLRRFDCVLAPSKEKILEMNKTLTVSNKKPVFKRLTGHDYYNVSRFDFQKLLDDSKYPDIVAHKSEHKKFVKKVLENVKQFEEGKDFVPSSFVTFLRDWILEHIAMVDRNYGLYIIQLKEEGKLNENILKFIENG